MNSKTHKRWSPILVLGPDDTVVPVITRYGRCRRMREVTVAVVHRRGETWTHVYACQIAPDARPVAHLVRVQDGDRLSEAVDWIARRSERAGPLFLRQQRAARP